MAAGSLDLEFAVTLPPGVSEEELARRLRSKAGQLNELLAQYRGEPGGPSGPPDLGGGFSPGRGRGSAPQRPPQATAGGGGYGAQMDLLNHPTSPIGPGFLRDGSYWQQRKGSRIAERKSADDAAKRERDKSAPPPFRARPVPHSVSAPLYQGIQASSRLRRPQSADATGQRRGRTADADYEVQGQERPEVRASSEERRPATAPGRELRQSSEERPPSFHARPVPWCVSAPLYDQMLIEDRRSRSERMDTRSRSQMRSSSLPPRLEAVRKRLCGEGTDPYSSGMYGANSGTGYRSSTPVPERQIARGAPPETRIMNRLLKAEIPTGLPSGAQRRAASAGAAAAIDAAENLARDVAAGASRVGWGVSSLHGSSYGISHVTRHKTPPRMRGQSVDRAAQSRPYSTTEVPDFAALHEKQRRERMKYQNREATQPEPFVFTVPSRSLRMRQAPIPKDPSKDPRFQRRSRNARRPQSVPCAAAIFAAGADGGSPSVKALERPSVTGPPRTTAKTLQAQQHVATALRERRRERVEEKTKIENARKVDPEIRARVRAAVGPVETIDEIVEKAVMEKKQTQRNTMSDKRRQIIEMHKKVNRRPLLMQQTDSVARARRLALFQFRGFLKDAGVANIDAHFQDDELDDIDRIRSDAAAAGGM